MCHISHMDRKSLHLWWNNNVVLHGKMWCGWKSYWVVTVRSVLRKVLHSEWCLKSTKDRHYSTGPYCLMSDFWKEQWFIINDVPRKTTTTTCEKSCRLLLWSQLSCEQHFSVVARELQCVKAVGHLQNLDRLRSTRGSCDFQRAGDVLMHNDAGVGWWGGSTGTPFPLYVRNLCDWHKLSLFVLPFFTFFFFC